MEPIFEAVLAGGHRLARILKADPGAVRIAAARDELVDSIPHWLYVGDTALHLASAALRLGAVKRLLQRGADPNAKNRRQATPLHYACDARPNTTAPRSQAAQARLIEELVEAGADLNRADAGGATPLHRAVRARSPAAVAQLLALGARTDGRLRLRNSTPLHLAAQPTGASGTAGALEQQLAIIRLLRDYRANDAATDSTGRTPADWANDGRVLEAVTIMRCPVISPEHARQATRARSRRGTSRRTGGCRR